MSNIGSSKVNVDISVDLRLEEFNQILQGIKDLQALIPDHKRLESEQLAEQIYADILNLIGG